MIFYIFILLNSIYFGNSLRIWKTLPSLNRQLYSKIDISQKLECQTNVIPVNGFYGLIGPKINYKNVSSLYDLFTGDGIIQGVFIENGNVTFTQSIINTEKQQFERKYGIFPYSKNLFITIMNILLNYLRIIPNLLGVANTAFLKVQDKTYVLFERDKPYEIQIDSNKKRIETIGKKDIPFLKTFSGHSKVINGFTETIEYDLLKNQVIWYQLDDEFQHIRDIHVPMKYMPLMHDFYSDNDYILMIDSPIKIDWMKIFSKKIPLYFDQTMPTFIYLIHKSTGKIESYQIDRSLYIFHYSDVKIKESTINILSPFYDNIDYNTILHNGKYRRLRIDRNSGNTQLFKYRELECLNLDFPVQLSSNFPKQYILRSIENGRINGFYVLEKTDIIKKILFQEYFICGEPSVCYFNNIQHNRIEPILLCFATSETKKMQYFIMINLETDERIEYPIQYPLFIGFHSIFLPTI